MSTSSAAQPTESAGSRQFAGIARPVVFRAVIGLLCLGAGVYAVASWLTSPDMLPAPLGSTPIPAAQLRMLQIFEIVVFCAALLGLSFKVVVPLPRRRGNSWDGLIMLALLCLWWQDPLDHYVNFTFLYNAYALRPRR